MEQYKLHRTIVFWNSARSSSQCAVDAQIFLNSAVYKAQCPRRPWSFVYYQGRLINSVFFALCRKHAAASCCHDGAQRWVIFTSASPHSLFWSLCVSGSITTRCVFFVCFVFFFALLYCTLAELSTSLHLSQITKHIPVGKMLTHERGSCVYGLSILKGGKK